MEYLLPMGAGIGTAVAAAIVLAVFHKKNRAVWVLSAVLLLLTAGVSGTVLVLGSGGSARIRNSRRRPAHIWTLPTG